MLAEHMTPAPFLAERIYAKTERGRAEVARRALPLGARERSVLIMLDGHKRCAALGALVSMAALAPILDRLETLGLILAVGSPREAAAPMAAASMAAAPMAAASMAAPAAGGAATRELPVRAALPHLAQARATMIRTAETYLGLLAADVVRQVTAASDEEQLLRALGHWHMAMQASKHGREVAHQHLDLIRSSLRAPGPSVPA